MTHKANFNFRKLTQDIAQKKMYIYNLGDLFGNCKAVELGIS